MEIAIRYFNKSKKGNTFKLTTAVSDAAGVQAQTVDIDLQESADILFLVNAMYAANIDKDVKRFLERNAGKIKCLINVNSAATGRSTLKVVKRTCEKLSVPVSEKEYHTVGSWLALNKGRPNEDDLNRLKDFVKEIIK